MATIIADEDNVHRQESGPSWAAVREKLLFELFGLRGVLVLF